MAIIDGLTPQQLAKQRYAQQQADLVQLQAQQNLLTTTYTMSGLGNAGSLGSGGIGQMAANQWAGIQPQQRFSQG